MCNVELILDIEHAIFIGFFPEWLSTFLSIDHKMYLGMLQTSNI